MMDDDYEVCPEDHPNDDDDLPDHTLSMRSASQYCLQLFADLPPSLKLEQAEKSKAEQLDTKRQQAYQEFWDQECPTIERINASELSTPGEFREKFHNQNLPCLINGLESSFDSVNQQWRGDNQQIHRNWFFKHLGEDALMPLRYEHQQSTLDSEGRATECETRKVPIKEWIQLLEDGGEYHYYLKDWHLIIQLQEQQKQQDHFEPLYECPEVFQFDILNSFLAKFTKGDYRFCYWGPAQSSTSRHSDVLHSFSWSYNVVGTKQWTFFDKDKQFTVIQKAGQAMFVPCTWQHEVVNVEETISLNHNWITTANIDRTWECLIGEMKAIHKELDGWDMADNLEGCESMLRGCVGLDVTAFFLMILMRLVELLITAPLDKNVSERSFDIYRLVQMIKIISEDDSVQLKERIEAVLQSKDMAWASLNIAKRAITLVERNG